MGGHELAGPRTRGIKRPNHLRNAHRHIHEARNMARCGGAVAGAGTHRDYGDRDDASRRVPGEIRLGL